MSLTDLFDLRKLEKQFEEQLKEERKNPPTWIIYTSEKGAEEWKRLLHEAAVKRAGEMKLEPEEEKIRSKPIKIGITNSAIELNLKLKKSNSNGRQI